MGWMYLDLRKSLDWERLVLKRDCYLHKSMKVGNKKIGTMFLFKKIQTLQQKI